MRKRFVNENVKERSLKMDQKLYMLAIFFFSVGDNILSDSYFSKLLPFLLPIPWVWGFGFLFGASSPNKGTQWNEPNLEEE